MIEELYNGFYITEPNGNNAFSFDQRLHQKIFVPPLIRAELNELKEGEEIVFAEVYEGVEKNLCGLQNYLLFYHNEKPVFVFDNHNHAFCFWVWAYQNAYIEMQTPLVHIDQHKDMREPEVYFESNNLTNLKEVFRYTNEDLNVGNFIQPALNVGLVSEVYMIDNQDAFEKILPDEYILDIDVDVFSDDMRYINDDYKLEMIRTFVERASIITVATSPYFIDQSKAIAFVKKIFT